MADTGSVSAGWTKSLVRGAACLVRGAACLVRGAACLVGGPGDTGGASPLTTACGR